MNYQTVTNLLREIPEISRGLKSNNAQAKKDMNRVITSLAVARNHSGAAEGTASLTALVNHLSTKSNTVSKDMQHTLGKMALLEFAKAFKSEADFLNDKKVKPLEKI